MSDHKEDKLLSRDIPKHIAIIMDGNGRWARKRTLPRIAGHREGVNSVREVTRICGEIDVEFLTLYTFSKENWKRPKKEVSALMTLLLRTINKEVQGLHKNNVKFNIIGDLEMLPSSTKKGLEEGINLTSQNTGLNLSLALNYGSRQEIVEATQTLAMKVKDGSMLIQDINEELFSKYLYTKAIPDPDLMIRTSGESRLSNFLLWQSAYTEIYMTNTYWPDFREKELLKAILDYQKRERRFGRVSEQVRGSF
jgi:undecaprenyl diphosphate synthase